MLEGLFQLADLDSEEPVRMSERRGNITVDLARTLYTAKGRDGLNGAVKEMLESGKWYQLWRGEIVSMQSSTTPRPASAPELVAAQEGPRELPKGEPKIIVRYVLDELLDDGEVRLGQDRGLVVFSLSPTCFTPEGLACDAVGALTAAAQGIVEGGQWIQVWDGEIITMYDGEDGGGTDGRIHRGPLVPEGSA
jgi:hypothetical protein